MSDAIVGAGDPAHPVLALNERQLGDLRLCIYYATTLAHGFPNHNLMMLVAMLAASHGFALEDDLLRLTFTPGVQPVLQVPPDQVTILEGVINGDAGN